MIDDSLQFQIHSGNQEAFLEMSRLCAKDIYLTALGVSGEEDRSRSATKNALLRFRRALIESEGPVDSDSMLSEFLEEELGMPLYPLPAIPDIIPLVCSPEPETAQSTEPIASPRSSCVSKPQKTSVASKQRISKEKQKKRPLIPFFDSFNSISPTDRWIIVFSAFSIFCMIWSAIGILMDLSILPSADLGYKWFNRHLFPLFHTF